MLGRRAPSGSASIRSRSGVPDRVQGDGGVKNITARARTLVRRTPPEVFDAIVDAPTMSKFWFTRRDGGLEAGKSCSWFIGEGPDAPEIEVFVESLDRPHSIVMHWDEPSRRVTWTFEEVDGDTRLAVEEVGFVGTDEEAIEQALDSTSGFNQVVIALKAVLEHGAALNVVADHA